MKKKNRKDILNCVYLPLAKKGRASDLGAEAGATEVTISPPGIKEKEKVYWNNTDTLPFDNTDNFLSRDLRQVFVGPYQNRKFVLRYTLLQTIMSKVFRVHTIPSKVDLDNKFGLHHINSTAPDQET